MIDPGRPFSRPYAELIAELERRLREGVEQPDRAALVFNNDVASYPLPSVARAVTRVTGLVGSRFTVFDPGRDYRFSSNLLIWREGGLRPDQGARFEVEFTFREPPSGLTDFNPGSGVSTLVRAVARGIKVLYEQMDEAYRRAFVEQATGVALDNVVALLGVARNPAQKARGEVTFQIQRAAGETVLIAPGTRVADATGREFVTTAGGTIPSAAPPEELEVAAGGTLRAERLIAEVISILAPGAVEGSPSLAFEDDDFGADGRTVTLDAPPAAGTTLVLTYRPRSVTVAVEAVAAGPDGNVATGSIVVMPTPPRGVDGVANASPTQGGLEAEADDRLRERAVHELERAGNATLDAIRFAVLDVDGVEDVSVSDHTTNSRIPLGEVRVRFSGGDREGVRKAIEETRAAGILARVESVRRVFVRGVFRLIAAPQAIAGAAGAFLTAAQEMIGGLGIGEPLSTRRLNALAFGVPGLADVAEASLTFRRRPDPAEPALALEGPVGDPFLVSDSEQIRPDAGELATLLLTGLSAHSEAPRQLSVQLIDERGAPAELSDFTLDLQIVLRAADASAPGAGRETIADVSRGVSFTASSTATLTLAAGDLSGFRPADHQAEVEAVLRAAAYPGLRAATALVVATP